MKDCATCEYRVELNPEFQNMEWDSLPCARCKTPSLHDDKPSARMILCDSAKMERITEAPGFALKPLTKIKTAEYLLTLITRIKDKTDLAIIQAMIANPNATFQEIGDEVGLKRQRVWDRVERMDADK